jgi:hypothetical protein
MFPRSASPCNDIEWRALGRELSAKRGACYRSQSIMTAIRHINLAPQRRKEESNNHHKAGRAAQEVTRVSEEAEGEKTQKQKRAGDSSAMLKGDGSDSICSDSVLLMSNEIIIINFESKFAGISLKSRGGRAREAHKQHTSSGQISSSPPRLFVVFFPAKCHKINLFYSMIKAMVLASSGISDSFFFRWTGQSLH